MDTGPGYLVPDGKPDFSGHDPHFVLTVPNGPDPEEQKKESLTTGRTPRLRNRNLLRNSIHPIITEEKNQASRQNDTGYEHRWGDMHAISSALFGTSLVGSGYAAARLGYPAAAIPLFAAGMYQIAGPAIDYIRHLKGNNNVRFPTIFHLSDKQKSQGICLENLLIPSRRKNRGIKQKAG